MLATIGDFRVVSDSELEAFGGAEETLGHFCAGKS